MQKPLITPNEINLLPSKEADASITYGEHKNQFYDLRLPKGINTPTPVVIVIHGGCWTSTYANYKNTQATADALRDVGFITINLEYRAVDHKGGGLAWYFFRFCTGYRLSN